MRPGAPATRSVPVLGRLSALATRSVLIIRTEQPGDLDAIRRINELAFGQAAEADLVDALRGAGNVATSLVAVREGLVVGHILFGPVSIESDASSTPAVGLGPMAVLPESQGSGIGSRLVEEGLAACREAGCEIVVVLGHATYYPRFGFVPASRHQISCEYDVPDEAFMVLELTEGALLGTSGTVKYAPEFGDAEFQPA